MNEPGFAFTKLNSFSTAKYLRKATRTREALLELHEAKSLLILDDIDRAHNNLEMIVTKRSTGLETIFIRDKSTPLP